MSASSRKIGPIRQTDVGIPRVYQVSHATSGIIKVAWSLSVVE